ncbi:DUF89 domain-containing protein [Candidatus Margulisiibacteriota bacterium]
MQSLFECIPCIVRQTLDIARLNNLSEQKKLKLMRTVMKKLEKVDPHKTTPPEATKWAHEIIKKELGKKDLYAKEKIKQNKLALKHLPWAEKEVKRAKDKLLTSVRLAIAGNIIDYGTASYFDLSGSLKALEHQQFAINDYARLKKAVSKPGLVLYIGDNAGEIAFDKILVKELMKRKHVVHYAIKSEPVLNDSLMKDAKTVGMDKLVPVLESGSTTAGTLLKEATPAFKKLYDLADIIIAKGQGNFETLPLSDKRIFFLLKMKCVYLGHKVDTELGDILLIQGNQNIAKKLG